MMDIRRISYDLFDTIRLFTFHLFTYAEYAFKKILPKPPKSLEGEIILVTGSGRGIGRYICLELAKHGATIVCWSKSAGPNQQVAELIRQNGGKAFPYSVDVSNKAAVEHTANLVRKEVGDVTICVNNAGLMKILPFLDTPEKDVESMFNVNILSHIWVIKQFLPRMLEQNRGHLVSICSAAGLLPTRNLVAYSSTKHAVHGLYDALRDELRMKDNNKIKITTVYPFYCSTEMLDGGIPHTRFPFLFPIDPPEVVSVKIVEGIRSEVEYLYTPRLVGWLAMFSWIVPLRAVDAYGDFLYLQIDPAPAQTQQDSPAFTKSSNKMMNGNANGHSVRG